MLLVTQAYNRVYVTWRFFLQASSVIGIYQAGCKCNLVTIEVVPCFSHVGNLFTWEGCRPPKNGSQTATYGTEIVVITSIKHNWIHSESPLRLVAKILAADVIRILGPRPALISSMCARLVIPCMLKSEEVAGTGTGGWRINMASFSCLTPPQRPSTTATTATTTTTTTIYGPAFPFGGGNIATYKGSRITKATQTNLPWSHYK